MAVVAGCLVSVASQAVTPGAGEIVYAKRCAECHGTSGRGVKDKYAEALSGDWSLEKLSRYVAKNMPEDDPGSLSSNESASVAAYVYEAFYSRAAQARINPVRIELTHLTNRQYVTSVADLVRQLEAPDPAAGTNGLAAEYYSNASKRAEFDPKKIARRMVESQLRFDFSVPSEDRITTGGEFSVRWEGSVLADESGDYEFVVRSSHSVRLWVNRWLETAQPSEAIVDAFVKGPEQQEHRVRLRLLGGRSYPIRLDCWVYTPKPNESPAGIELRWKPPHGAEQTVPARNLRSTVVAPTLVVSTPFPPDDSSLGYARGIAVSKAWDDATTQAAFEVANYVQRNLDRLSRTQPETADRLSRLRRFAAEWVAAAFRRPLRTEEARLIDGIFMTAPSPENAVKRAVLLALKSPQFLYPAIGGCDAPEWGVAIRLALAVWDSVPDPVLAHAVAAGRLRSRDQVLAEATRMMGDPRAKAKMRYFLHQWLQLGQTEILQKDPALFPDFTPEVIADLRTSLNLFLDEAVWRSGSGYRELLLADFLFVNDRLAKFYGLPAPPDGEFSPVRFSAAQRAGVVTHPYLLAAFSYKSTTSPIHRGVFLTRNIVGRALKSPPTAVAFDETEFPPGLSMREKIAKLTRSENCQSCHAVINPLGFSLEWYDPVGRFREQENGRSIDAISDYITDEGTTVRLSGARDVAEFAAASEHAHFAFIEQLFHQSVQQPLMAYGPNVLAELRQAFVASNFNIPALWAEIAVRSALHAPDTSAPASN